MKDTKVELLVWSLFKYTLYHLYVVYLYTDSCRKNHNDTIIKTTEDFFKKIYLSLYCNVCEWEGVGDRIELQYIDSHSYGHQRCVFLVLLMLNRMPGGPLCWLSLLHLITNWSGPQTPSGVPRAPSACWWLSLPHLVSNSSDLQLVWSPTLSGSLREPSAGRGLSLPHLVSDISGLELVWLPVSQSYKIV